MARMTKTFEEAVVLLKVGKPLTSVMGGRVEKPKVTAKVTEPPSEPEVTEPSLNPRSLSPL